MGPFVPTYIHFPTVQLDQHKQQVFARLFSDTLAHPGDGIPVVQYVCPYPKHEFLHYLVEHHWVLVHGSTRPGIEILEPRAESDNAGRVIHAVFAASDGIWSMFFAILDRKPYPFSVHNGCRREPGGTVYYFSTSTLHDQPWTDGMMYILPRDAFERISDADGNPTEQWMSRLAVRPLAKLEITPTDFSANALRNRPFSLAALWAAWWP
jgi:hypothetical protein